MMLTIGEFLCLVLGVANLIMNIFTFCNVTIKGDDEK